MTEYPAIYVDKFGEEHTSVVSDGESLKVVLRGQSFEGRNFDSLDMETGNLSSLTNNFAFNEYNSLTDCSFKIKFPVRLKEGSKDLQCVLNVEIVLEGSKYPITKQFNLVIGEEMFDIQKNGESGMYFESQMIQLQRRLPHGIKINSCIFCAYSNYSVYGSDSFGTLICFKEIKEDIVKVNNKNDYVDISMNYGIATQETFWCSEFKEIEKGQWQYKDSI